jgi:hypothetical protein
MQRFYILMGLFVAGISSAEQQVSDDRSRSVSVPTAAGSLAGHVDSSLIDRLGSNTVRVYTGKVSAKALDDARLVPVAEAPIEQARCSFGYRLPHLSPAVYTLLLSTDVGGTVTRKAVDSIRYKGGDEIHDFAPTGRVLRVGRDGPYRKPSDVVPILRDGDVVEIEAGDYPDDVVVWSRNHLTIRGVNGRARIRATRPIPYRPGHDQENGKGIWVVKGSRITIENVEIAGARVPDRNGAGIRAEGEDLAVCGSYFHDNENGILGGRGTVVIEYSEFAHNGLGQAGQTHNVYIDRARRLIFQYNDSHHAHIGHNLKSRAAENFVLYNSIMDGADGDSSYAVDLPNGGSAYLIGNVLQQGSRTENSNLVSFGAEGMRRDRSNELFAVNNTWVNDLPRGTFLKIAPAATALVVNNLFVGKGTLIRGPGTLRSNVRSDGEDLVDRAGFDYHLTAASAARDAGEDPGAAPSGFDLRPQYEYIRPAGRAPRIRDRALDAGAYEFLK